MFVADDARPSTRRACIATSPSILSMDGPTTCTCGREETFEAAARASPSHVDAHHARQHVLRTAREGAVVRAEPHRLLARRTRAVCVRKRAAAAEAVLVCVLLRVRVRRAGRQSREDVPTMQCVWCRVGHGHGSCVHCRTDGGAGGAVANRRTTPGHPAQPGCGSALAAHRGRASARETSQASVHSGHERIAEAVLPIADLHGLLLRVRGGDLLGLVCHAVERHARTTASSRHRRGHGAAGGLLDLPTKTDRSVPGRSRDLLGRRVVHGGLARMGAQASHQPPTRTGCRCHLGERVAESAKRKSKLIPWTSQVGRAFACPMISCGTGMHRVVNKITLSTWLVLPSAGKYFFFAEAAKPFRRFFCPHERWFRYCFSCTAAPNQFTSKVI